MLFQFGFYHDLRSKFHFNNRQILYFLSLRYFFGFIYYFFFVLLFFMFTYYGSVNSKRAHTPRSFVGHLSSCWCLLWGICRINIVFFLKILYLKYVYLDKEDNTLLV